MQRRQIPQGYASILAAHNQPAKADPPPPIIERKEAQTLMGHCLKQFIRERLYGNIVNYNRNNNKKLIFASPLSELQDKRHLDLKNINSNLVANPTSLPQSQTSQENRSHERYPNVKSSLQINEEPIIPRHRNSLGSIQDSLQLQVKRQRMNRSNMSRKYEMGRQKNKSIDSSIQRYRGSSFLSAIEQDDHRVHQFNRKEKKLTPLIKNAELKERLEKMGENNKSPTRLQNENLFLNLNIWELFCRSISKVKEPEGQKGSTTLTNEPSLADNQSHLSNIAKTLATVRSVLPFKSTNNFEKSKFLVAKTVFSRESFNDYLNNYKYSIPSLAQLCLNFFELNGKFNDDMKTNDYKRVMDVMATAGDRVWGICAFRFWDADQNGMICSNDIFQTYRYLDQIKTVLAVEEIQQTSRGLYNCKIMMKSLESLRQKIISQKFDQKLDPQGKILRREQVIQNFNIKYLQEAIIKKKDIKYSDLGLILGPNIRNNNKQQKHSVIESVQQLGIKFTSCYRHSFLATDHNEQTRQNRQYIENLKQILKKEKIQLIEKEEELINKKPAGISYSTFMQFQHFKAFKQIALSIFGLQLVDNK